jgi:hypothetical protein
MFRRNKEFDDANMFIAVSFSSDVIKLYYWKLRSAPCLPQRSSGWMAELITESNLQ